MDPLTGFLKKILDRSDQQHTTPSGRFKIHYRLRTPPKGKCWGLESVDDLGLIDLIATYAKALDNTYEYLKNQKWEEPDRGPARDPITVLVFDTPDPFTGLVSLPGGVAVGLRSELAETTPEACQARAAIDASHEAVHIFTFVHRMRKNSKGVANWAWFDEATAVHFERLLNEDNPLRLSNGYALNWVNFPESGLEVGGADAGYHAAWFVRHLVNRYGPRFLRDAWHKTLPGETPCQVIDRLLKERGSRKSSLEKVIHNYAVRSRHTSAFDSLANRRYGDRKFAYILPLDGTGDLPDDWRDYVEPLGCRYYRIGPVQTPRRIAIEVLIDDPAAVASLIVSIHVDGPGSNGRAHPRSLKLDRRTTAPSRFFATFEAPHPGTEFVLIVSYSTPLAYLSDSQDARLNYQVKVTEVKQRSRRHSPRPTTP